jgi:uncharacterized protein YjbI with pentapeptide repeats
MSLIQLMHEDEQKVLFKGEFNSVKEAIEAAVKGDVDLTGLDVCGQHLEDLDCGCGKFDNSEWKGAYLKGANLAGSTMKNSTFRGADVRGVNFGGNDVSGSDFDGIIVDADTNFRGTTWTTK